jgi:hypothetical protein
MASVTDIREGLKARLDTISGLRAHAWVVGDIVPPAAIVIPGDPSRKSSLAIAYDATMGRGSDDFLFTLLILVSNKVERSAQEALDGYLAGSGATSVKAAVEGEDSLGGVAHFTRVVGVRDYGLVTYGGQTYVGAEFMVEVCASGEV